MMSLAGWVKPAKSRKEMAKALDSESESEGSEGEREQPVVATAVADPPAKRTSNTQNSSSSSDDSNCFQSKAKRTKSSTPPPPFVEEKGGAEAEEVVVVAAAAIEDKAISRQDKEHDVEAQQVVIASPSSEKAQKKEEVVVEEEEEEEGENATFQNYLKAGDWAAAASPTDDKSDKVPAWARRGAKATKRKRKPIVKKATTVSASKKKATAAKEGEPKKTSPEEAAGVAVEAEEVEDSVGKTAAAASAATATSTAMDVTADTGEAKREIKNKAESLVAAASTAAPSTPGGKKNIANSFFAPRVAKKKVSSSSSSSSYSSSSSSIASRDKASKFTSAATATVAAEAAATAMKQKPSRGAPLPSAKVKVADYNPAAEKYHPIESACWTTGQPVPYGALCATFSIVEEIAGRLEITRIVANFLRSVMVLSPDDLVHVVYLCTNSLAPAFEGVELGIGESILMKAVVQATGCSKELLKKRLVESGDLGAVAAANRGKQRTLSFGAKKAPLTVNKVFDGLTRIAKMTGGKSQQKKVDIINALLVDAAAGEAKYIIRSLEGKLRIGLAEQTVLQALGVAVTLTPPVVEKEVGAEEDVVKERVLDACRGLSPDRVKERCDANAMTIKTVFCELPSYDRILPILMSEGLSVMAEKCGITPGVPMKPMLAHPTKGIEEVFKRFEDKAFACEYKYDGERAQVHLLDNGEVHIYSRNSENNTSKYPDIIERMPGLIKDTVTSFVIDCEAVAYDVTEKKILPFQVLSTRKRKDAVADDIKVQVCLFAFDLIYLNGESYVRRPFRERREALHASFSAVEGQFHFATCMLTDDVEQIGVFLDQSIKDSCEGLMVKTLDEDATYEIARRSHSWLKVKKDYLEGVGDSLDLVVMGGWRGKGKRTGTYGALLCGCYDPDSEEVQSICKLGTGFSDEDLKQHAAFFNQHTTAAPPSYYRFDQSLVPDVWFQPCQVFEVLCADLSISPRHKAAIGLVSEDRGISLRFPRFIRIRDDKKVEMATSAEQVAAMYQNQDVVKNAS